MPQGERQPPGRDVCLARSREEWQGHGGKQSGSIEDRVLAEGGGMAWQTGTSATLPGLKAGCPDCFRHPDFLPGAVTARHQLLLKEA